MSTRLPAFVFLAIACLLTSAHARASEPTVVSLETPIAAEILDASAFAQWVDGAEQRIRPKDERDKGALPAWVIATAKGNIGHNGLLFGQSKTPGPRHLRIAFKSPVRVGTVLVRGGGQLSVLRPDAVFPGNLADASQWIAAERLVQDQIGREEAGRDDYAVWTLPAPVNTRALRFTHTAVPVDKEYAGWLGGAYLLSERLANLAPQALVASSANFKDLPKLVNEKYESGWTAWSNIALKDGDRAQPVSAESPEWLIFTWPAAVKLRGLSALWAGFAAADAQVYTGPADVHPREAAESQWRTVKSFSGLRNRYPASMGADFLDFGAEIETRALRLRITQATDDDHHPHMHDHARNGRRVWLGELLALRGLGTDSLQTVLVSRPKAVAEKPPIAVPFTMPEAGWVTLVIENSRGVRVRNLIADTFFEKGEQVVGWDGTDDLGRDLNAPKHGVYFIPAQFVEPGNYRVRGLWHKQVDLRYEFPVYTAGNPAWNTADTSGGWLANHTPPGAVVFVPDAGQGAAAVLIGSYVSEGTAGLAWVDLDGRKFKGQTWIGGAWTGAQFLARDAGRNAAPGVVAYAAAAWSIEENANRAKSRDGEIRITAILAGGDKPVVRFTFTPPPTVKAQHAEDNWGRHLGGLAAHDGRIVFSMPVLGQIVSIDAKSGRVLGRAAIEDPRGLAFDAQGRLLVLSGRRLLRFTLDSGDAGSPLPTNLRSVPGEGQGKIGSPLPLGEGQGVRAAANRPSVGNSPHPDPLPKGEGETAQSLRLSAPETLIADASVLEDPQGLTLDAAGNIYVSDRGNSHQVKVFSPDGKLLRTIGTPGAPAAGPYDPRHMNNPHGLTLDANGRLWVAEEDNQPKRVSVWNADGTLWRAFYGPAEYGGGGRIDPRDPTRLYYLGMEFRLDWQQGTNQLSRVFLRRKPHDPDMSFRAGMPEMPFYVQGRRYFTDCYSSNPTGGAGVAKIWLDRDGIAVPVASLGRANLWDLLKGDAFKPRWPAGVDLTKDPWKNSALFVWSDLNGDGHVQPEEVVFEKAATGGVTVMSDLAFTVARVEGKAMRYAPRRFTPGGAPVYDLSAGEVLVEGTQNPPSSGGDQVLAGPDGWTVLTNAPKPFSAHGLGGARGGVPVWSYPSLWPGLHASHEAPVPDRPGMVIGHTRLLGDLVTPRGGDAGPMWIINGNHGNMYVFTLDGLFVAQLFQDMRVGRQWAMPIAPRGMVLNDVTCHDENFWPSVSQTPDGSIFLYSGGHLSLVRVEGLQTARRIAPFTLDVTAADLERAREYIFKVEAARQAAQGRGILTVAMRAQPPVVDGRLDDWAGADWVDIDHRGTAAYFDSKSKPFNVTGAVAVCGDRLYAAWRTGEKELLRNSGETPLALFKTGGALDLMIGADPQADPKRSRPVAGDLRLLVTQVKDKTRAMLYRAVVPGTKDPVPFSSPSRTITLDRADDVSGLVELAADGAGNFEISVPLSVLGVKPALGMVLRGDIGILRGDSFITTQRVYWCNKATAITADVPSEAELRPNLWGKWEFKP
jgi:hypothetical protein